MKLKNAKSVFGLTVAFSCSFFATFASTEVAEEEILEVTIPYNDSTQVKREQFRKEYKEKLIILESQILQTRERIKNEKKETREKWNKELDELEGVRKDLSTKLENQEEMNPSEWQKFTVEVREEYDETESKVRNFFKK